MASGPEHYAAAENLIESADEAYLNSSERGDYHDVRRTHLLESAAVHAQLATAAAHLAGRNSVPRQWAEVLEP